MKKERTSLFDGNLEPSIFSVYGPISQMNLELELENELELDAAISLFNGLFMFCAVLPLVTSVPAKKKRLNNPLFFFSSNY